MYNNYLQNITYLNSRLAASPTGEFFYRSTFYLIFLMLEELIHFVSLVVTTFSSVLLKFKLDAVSPILCSFITRITFRCSNSSYFGG